MQRSMVFMLGGSVGLACGLAVGQLGAADLDLADEEIARLVVQLEDLERDKAAMEVQLERWIGGAPALPADVEIVAPIPAVADEEGITENDGGEDEGEVESEDEAESDNEDEAESDNEGESETTKPQASAPAKPAAGSEPSVADLLGELLAAEGEALVDAEPPAKPAPKPAAKPAPKPSSTPASSGWSSGDAPKGWPSGTPRNLHPAAVDAAVRAAVSGVGELAAVDCSSFPCVVAVQASEAGTPCCDALQQRLRAIDGYLMYAGPAQPLTVGGRATVITTWYPAGSDVDLEAVSRRMDALRRGL